MKNEVANLKTIFIVGPTASGKSALAIGLAKMINAEIICADSQTVRRYMNIGTAKPTAEDQSMVPHHLIDVVDPYNDFSLADFLRLAEESIRHIRSNGRNVIIVGGTGLYTDALYFNFELPAVSNEENSTEKNVELLHAEIFRRGLELPKNSQNPRHLVNVIKRNGQTGVAKSPSPESIIIGINPGREKIIERINRRVDEMFENGFEDEVRAIINRFGPPKKDFDAIGYRIIYRYIMGEISLEEAKEKFKIGDRQYARKQMSWYRRNGDIVWFSSPEEALHYILKKVT
ncbi:tRNA dimethylallyltransferase [Candidatus Saccharibacteria bacterium]|nr:tRNA dimethylallyltransferase [Candidatus Saccharibacteria bacterium]